MSDNTLSKIWKFMYSLALSPMFMYFEPYSMLVKAIGILVVFDIISGMIAARKEGQSLTSRALFRKLPQLALFLLALAAAKESSPLLEQFALEPHQAGRWLCSLYGVYELFSILENLGRSGMPVAKPILALLRSKLPDEVKDIDVSPDVNPK